MITFLSRHLDQRQVDGRQWRLRRFRTGEAIAHCRVRRRLKTLPASVRRPRLMHKVDASRLNLARQFRARPFGPHGSELQKLLKILLGPDPGPHHRGSAATRRGLATGPEHRSQGASNRDLRWARVCHTGRGAMGHFPPALGTPYRPGALPGGQRASSDCRPSEHRCEPSFRPGLCRPLQRRSWRQHRLQCAGTVSRGYLAVALR